MHIYLRDDCAKYNVLISKIHRTRQHGNFIYILIHCNLFPRWLNRKNIKVQCQVKFKQYVSFSNALYLSISIPNSVLFLYHKHSIKWILLGCNTIIFVDFLQFNAITHSIIIGYYRYSIITNYYRYPIIIINSIPTHNIELWHLNSIN